MILVIFILVYVIRVEDEIQRCTGRTYISGVQSQILKNYFNTNRFPNRSEKNSLMSATGLGYAVITNWFQNKRKREKKHLEQ